MHAASLALCSRQLVQCCCILHTWYHGRCAHVFQAAYLYNLLTASKEAPPCLARQRGCRRRLQSSIPQSIKSVIFWVMSIQNSTNQLLLLE
jgi:hypothetical protein